RGAVEPQKWAAPAVGARVDGFGKDLFAGASFTRDQHRDAARRGAHGDLVGALHLRIEQNRRSDVAGWSARDGRHRERTLTVWRLNDDQRDAGADEVARTDRASLGRRQARLGVVAARGLLGARIGFGAEERGAVGAAEIFHLDQLADMQGKVESRDRRIVDAQVVAGAASNSYATALWQVKDAALLTQ